MKTTNTELLKATVIEDAKTRYESMYLPALVEELNSARATASGAEISLMVQTAEAKCKAVTGDYMDARINALLDLEPDRVALFTDFIQNPTYASVRLAQDKETGEYALKYGSKVLSFDKLEKAYQRRMGQTHADGSVDPDTKATLTRDKKYYAMLTYFVDNMGRNIAGDLSEQAGKVVAPAYVKADPEKRQALDFSGDSITALEKQLNYLVSTILPEGMEVKMKRADVRALKQAATKEHMLKFKLQHEAFFMGRIFAAIKTRMNCEAYTLESNAKIHKAPSTTSNAKACPPDTHTVDMAAAIPNRA